MKDNRLKARSPSAERTDRPSRPLSFSTPLDEIVSQVDATEAVLIQQAGAIDEEAALILHAQQGDMEASNRLAQATYPRVLNYIRNRLRCRLTLKLSAQRVEEIAEVKAQDTYERAWKKLPDYQPQGKPFLAMLYGIAQKICHETLRELAREWNVVDIETCQDLEAEQSSYPEKVVMMMEELEELHRALKTLSPTEQLIIQRHYRDKQSYREIAQALNITVSNAKNKSYRGREKLKQLLVASDMLTGPRQHKQSKRACAYRSTSRGRTAG